MRDHNTREKEMITGLTHVDAFIAKVAHTAQAVGRKWKVPPSVIIAQAALETGWGQAVKGNAYFGIKQGASKSEAIALPTREVIDGQVVSRVERFRTYRSLQEAANAYGEFLHETPRYKKALNTSDPAKFAEELQQAGYATDPDYATKLKRIIQRYELTTYDHVQQTKPPQEASGRSTRGWDQSGSGGSDWVPADPKQLTPYQRSRDLRPLSLEASRTSARYQKTLTPVSAAAEGQPRLASGGSPATDRQRLTTDQAMQTAQLSRGRSFTTFPSLFWEQIRQFTWSRGWQKLQPSKPPPDTRSMI
jgi:hypothetical protein